MSKLVGFMLRLGEDIYQAQRKQLNTWCNLPEILDDEVPEVEPPTSIESISE